MTAADRMAASQAETLRREWSRLLSTEPGRMLVWSILQPLHLLESTHTGNSNGAWMEGRRSVALDLIRDFISPNGAGLLGQMMAEHQGRMEAIERAKQSHSEETDG